jgi:hypothetical protein
MPFREYAKARGLAEDTLARRRLLGDDHPTTRQSSAFLKWLREQAEDGA